MVDYCSNFNTELNKKTGKEAERITAPISATKYNEITEKLSEYGTDVYGVGSDACTYHAILDKNTLTDEMLQAPNIFDEHQEVRVELVAVDDKLYRKLCDRAGAVYGSNLLINSYEYNNNGRYVTIKPYKDDITEIRMINAANKKQIFDVGGILKQEDLKEQGFREMNPYPIRLVVPDVDARSFDWFSMPTDELDYTKYARKVMDAYYPITTKDSYVEQGYTVRIARTDVMVKMLNIAIVLAEIVIYGFVILLILMGFTSVIGTLATNVRIRSREFAILKSIGMTNKSLYKMLYCESILCIIRALIPGIVLGITIPFAINLSIRKIFPILYHIPWVILVAGIVGLIMVVLLITRVQINRLKNRSIIDEIRRDVI